MVEGRNGAIVWQVSTGTQVQLSSGADSNAQTFFADSLIWDYDSRQLSGTLTFEQYGTAIYSLDTGELHGWPAMCCAIESVQVAIDENRVTHVIAHIFAFVELVQIASVKMKQATAAIIPC